MTDSGCQGCEWAKGRFQILESHSGSARTVARASFDLVQKYKEESDKVKAITLESINAAHGSIKAAEETRKDNIDFKKSVSAEFRNVMLGVCVSLLLMVAATVWGNLAKLGQDSKNQVETASYLEKLSLAMSTLERRLNQIPENSRRH
jgi:hypothetical protein